MIKSYINSLKEAPYPSFLDAEHVKIAREFHESIPQYSITPLVELDEYARQNGIKGLWVKDESYRYGLNAFKALGAMYAAYQVVEREKENRPVTDITLVTATDGNHGRAVAFAASQLGCRAVVYMPKGSSLFRLKAIQNHGAEAEILDMNYDDAVRYANAKAEKHGWFIVQDTAWDGYEAVPNDIALGYTVMVDEALEQLAHAGHDAPTHVFLQAGVGSMAGGVLGYLVNRMKGKHPKTVILEADQADCLYQSMVIGDGIPHAVTGDLNTIMAGLACGEANTITFDILKNWAYAFLSCADEVTKIGMRQLAYPIGSDPKVISGESGAVGMGALHLILTHPDYTDLKAQLGIDADSRILLFSTEGNTDPETYAEIVGQ